MSSSTVDSLSRWSASEALCELSQLDHALVSGEFCQLVCVAFSVDLPHQRPSLFSDGIGAHKVAEHVCTACGVHFHRKIGVGSALRECCAKLAIYLANSPSPSLQ